MTDRRPRLRSAAPWLLAALLGVLWALLAPPTPDLAAQVYRTGLFEREGFTLFNAQWYAGHHTPGYSVIFPPLAALLGPRLVGLLAAIASAFLFERLVRAHFGARAWPGAVWFGAATATDLLIGRLTFGLGVTLGLGALLALQRSRPGWAAALAVGCTLASPVAGLFLAMAGVAHALATRVPAGAWMAAAAFVPAVALAIAFPEGGHQPWGFWSFAAVVGIAAAAWRLLPRAERALRAGVALYAAGAVAAFSVATPMGSNATRLAALFAGPVLLAALAGRARPRLLAAAAVPLLAWQWWGPVRETAKGAVDPSHSAAFYAPLLGFLEGRADAATRVEIPFTRMHWEAVHVARRYPLARGWEAQLDRKYNDLFHDRERLDAEGYRRWLLAHGVRYVALPDVPLDPAGRAEARLIRSEPRFLKEVWRNRHWRVFVVRGARDLAGTSATVGHLGPSSFTLEARRPGPVLVRVRWTPYWRVVDGDGCVARGVGDWTVVNAARAGRLRVAARFDPTRIVSRGPACSG